MKFSFGAENPNKKVGRRDASIIRKETEQEVSESLQNRERKYVRYEKLQQDLDILIQEYFPEEFKEFQKPSLKKVGESFAASVNHFRYGEEKLFKEEEFENAGDMNIHALMAAAVIRYVDNFIDEALWPHIHDYDQEVFRAHFSGFLRRAFILAKFYDANIPEEIINMPLLEMELELDHSQNNFDKNVIALVEQKAFDLAYINSLFSHDDISKDSLWYKAKSLEDIGRDFLEEHKHDSDFNIYNYTVRYNLDPKIFTEYVIKFFSEFFPYGFRPNDYDDDDEGRVVMERCTLIIEKLSEIERKQLAAKFWQSEK